MLDELWYRLFDFCFAKARQKPVIELVIVKPYSV